MTSDDVNYPFLIGILVASFVGSLWAAFEREHPEYWAYWGISRTTADLITNLTALLFPWGQLLIFLAVDGWIRATIILIMWHVAATQLLGGLTYGAISGLLASRVQRRSEEWLRRQEADDHSARLVTVFGTAVSEGEFHGLPSRTRRRIIDYKPALLQAFPSN